METDLITLYLQGHVTQTHRPTPPVFPTHRRYSAGHPGLITTEDFAFLYFYLSLSVLETLPTMHECSMNTEKNHGCGNILCVNELHTHTHTHTQHIAIQG